uniref:beta-N-acetylhexosaminidase n=1 Tax=Thaumasiovibrio occultus TaxID=1891184 RepID=UPI000B35B528|nr:beta-N-acetylhexosaminidase [Thaumasiovibrio occultus]
MVMRLDLTLVANTENGSKLGLSLFNLSEQTISDWQLEFAFVRRIDVASLRNGELTQTGTHCCLKPTPVQATLAPNQHFYTEFVVNLPHLTLKSYGVLSAVIRQGDTLIPVQVTPMNLGADNAARASEKKPVTISAKPAPAALPLIPKPVEMTALNGMFTLAKHCVIAGEAKTTPAAAWLAEILTEQCKLTLNNGQSSTIGSINFVRRPTKVSGAYELLVEPEAIWLSAADDAGFFAGIASLLQLIPATPNEGGGFQLPCAEIKDQPRFDYRGVMLDCARHFHPISTIKRVLDQMARLKFNAFHWHLTDDEGWRIEIKGLPQLTDIGAWRGPNETLEAQYSHCDQRYGGFYRQDEIRDIIVYAAQRGIRVIPEIDVPGHCRAAIKALPELLAEPEDRSDFVSIQNYRDNVLCPGLAGTYTFLDTVLDEVCDLFPDSWVHIGGDEVPAHVWEQSPACQALMQEHGYSSSRDLQGHLLRYIQQRLHQRGKRMLGWEEIIEGEKVGNSALLFPWKSENAAQICLEKGFDVVLQPAPRLYLDLVQSACQGEKGSDWAGQLPLEKVYQYQPLADIDARYHAQVIGIQAALWSEYVSDDNIVDYMLFPRLFAVAEVAWSQQRDWPQFLTRLTTHLTLMDRAGVSYRPLDNNN